MLRGESRRGTSQSRDKARLPATLEHFFTSARTDTVDHLPQRFAVRDDARRARGACARAGESEAACSRNVRLCMRRHGRPDRSRKPIEGCTRVREARVEESTVERAGGNGGWCCATRKHSLRVLHVSKRCKGRYRFVRWLVGGHVIECIGSRAPRESWKGIGCGYRWPLACSRFLKS